MEKCFINGLGCVSGQETIQNDFLKSPIDHSNAFLIQAQKPDYKSFIPPAAIRRMSSGVKNSIVASACAMKEAEVEEVDGIITGTGMGCIQDSEKFLSKLIEYNEEYLTPTPFIQSTHNTVAGQIALNLKSKTYNFTYVHAGNSFQSALLDGMMKVQENSKKNILVGGVDEIGDHSLMLFRLVNINKKEGQTANVFNPKTLGAVMGEAAVFFVLGKEKKENTYAELVDVDMMNEVEENKVENYISQFLKKHQLSNEDIDAVILGNNGDTNFDNYYTEAENVFLNSEKVYFKHLFGEFHASPSIGLWVAAQIIKQQQVPEVLYKNVPSTKKKRYNNVLIYTQYRGKDHSLMLLKNV